MRTQKKENRQPQGYIGRKATVFSLTFNGLILCLYYNLKKGDIDLKKITKIAQKQQHLLPLIFGKWKFFKECDLEKEALNRLAMALIVVGSSVEKIVEGKRIHLDILKASKEESKAVLKDLREKLTGSERRGLPSDPVYTSEKEEQYLFRGLYKSLKEALQETGEQLSQNIYVKIEKGLTAIKTIKEGVNELNKLHMRNFNTVFLFGSKDYLISPKGQRKFLETVCIDAELKAFASECLQELEEKQKKNLSNIQSWKEIIR